VTTTPAAVRARRVRLPRRRRGRRGRDGGASPLAQPARLVGLGFLVLIAVGTVLLALPVSTAAPGGTNWRTALFTATSATTLTGFAVVDTGTYWSGAGQAVLLVLMQLGGLGVMTFASLLGLLVAGRLGLRSRLLARAETRTSGLGTVGRVVRGIVVVSLAVEAVLWLVLFLRFWLGRGQSPGGAAWTALFSSVSAYTNAGFALSSDSLVGVATDPLVIVPIAVAFVVGGIGYPVLLELVDTRLRPRTWSLHTRLTLMTTAVLLVLGPIAVIASEWSNPATLGALDVPGRLLSGGFSGLTPRSAGFNTIDYGQADSSTLLVTDILMVIGGGSAGTAGGIKVTTLAVLALGVFSEARGDPDIDVFRRRIAPGTVRQALAVASLALVAVSVGCLELIEITDLELDVVLFEVCAAFGTVGLSTGVTADLPPAAHDVLVVLMFLGRVGPITAATALALRSRTKAYRNPEGRPIVG
jgi:Trk-type K+ transport system membrane component